MSKLQGTSKSQNIPDILIQDVYREISWIEKDTFGNWMNLMLKKGRKFAMHMVITYPLVVYLNCNYINFTIIILFFFLPTYWYHQRNFAEYCLFSLN